ncbi:MarR family winged helix-turn-helix transcriptional regulator [Bosea thiooxidans]|nr:MarR family winged helix-turn-helix transcriptional regulator [Bosea sp. (in: a-proteobacteria)]
MRPNKGKSPAPASQVGALRDLLGGTDIPTAYKLGYILNFYREPSFRRIEAELGLTRPEIVILLALHFREGITAAEFCEFSGHLKAGVSRAAIALAKKELITRVTDQSDSRRQRLFLTDAGRDIYRRYAPALKAREAAMLACLSHAERRQLDGLLEKLAAHVPDWGSTAEL